MSKSYYKTSNDFLISLKLGFFLALRQVKRSNKATTGLIIFVMTLTFLNLVVVRGVLVGLIEGSVQVYRNFSTGEIFISKLPKKSYIENSPYILETVKTLPWVQSFSPRYLESGNIEADYKTKIRLTDASNSAGGVIAGINPEAENATTNLSAKIVEGQFLTSEDTEYILLGSSLLKKYVPVDSASFSFLENVEPGTKVRVTVGGNTKEFTVKGVIQSKADEVDFRAYILDTTLRNMIGRTDYNVDEVAIRLKPGVDPVLVKEALLKSGVGETARVQTADDALPKFVIDIKNTFAILGNVVGSIGLVVASITIFIVIFVNAITRRKFIGILKGIGISSQAIEIAYVFQSLFYAVLGIGIGLLFLYGFLVPFIAANPIKFPFSDGILVAEVPATFFRVFLLSVATLVAGYVPARIVVKKNTLDSILGR
jgi:ABC-type lipoprotein release transport system permease subunit